MHRRLCVALAIAGCGRIGFDITRGDARSDGTLTPMQDALGDGVPGDAAGICNPLTTVTPAQCAAAFANPAMATDQVIYDCAASCQFGACYVIDQVDCPTCSCTAYVKSGLICDPQSGTCTAPLSGTGCLGGNFYAGAPMNCNSAGGLAVEGACILRYLQANSDC